MLGLTAIKLGRIIILHFHLFPKEERREVGLSNEPLSLRDVAESVPVKYCKNMDQNIARRRAVRVKKVLQQAESVVVAPGHIAAQTATVFLDICSTIQ